MAIQAKVADPGDQTGVRLCQEDGVEFTIEGPRLSHSVVRPSEELEGYNGQEFDF